MEGSYMTCRTCGRTLPVESFYIKSRKDGVRRTECKDCTKERIHKYRMEHYERVREIEKASQARTDFVSHWRKWKEKNIEKVGKRWKIYSRLARAVKSGKVVKPTACECCGKEGKLEAHHWDYDRPLSVVWLCYRCHGMYHKAAYDDTREVKDAVEKLIERKKNNE